MENEQILAARLRLLEFSFDHSLPELLRETLDEAEQLTGSCIGFYHFMHSDQQMLTLQAWSTRTATRFCNAEGTGNHYAISQAGVWVDCVRQRQPVIHNDYASLAHRKGLPEGHAAVIRELVVPVFRADRIVAILGVGNKTLEYDQHDVAVVTLLADLAWDIVERKKADDTLHETNLLLEQEIGERQRAQEQLALQHQRLEELNRTLEQRVERAVHELRIKDQLIIQQNRQAVMGEMINNIAHQWKQPLNNLTLMIQALQADFKDGLLTSVEMDRETEKFLDLTAYMGHTIDDFRDFFRVNRQKVVFDFKAVAERTVRLMSASLAKQGVQVTIAPAAAITLEGYPNEFSQVLMNLLGNARDVLVERSVSLPLIEIEACRLAERVRITVSDNGGGIAPDLLEHIFEPYISTKGSCGTGIGLPMAKTIIEQHMGGTLRAENHGAGARFTIEVPLGAKQRSDQ